MLYAGNYCDGLCYEKDKRELIKYFYYSFKSHAATLWFLKNFEKHALNIFLLVLGFANLIEKFA